MRALPLRSTFASARRAATRVSSANRSSSSSSSRRVWHSLVVSKVRRDVGVLVFSLLDTSQTDIYSFKSVCSCRYLSISASRCAITSSSSSALSIISCFVFSSSPFRRSSFSQVLQSNPVSYFKFAQIERQSASPFSPSVSMALARSSLFIFVYLPRQSCSAFVCSICLQRWAFFISIYWICWRRLLFSSSSSSTLSMMSLTSIIFSRCPSKPLSNCMRLFWEQSSSSIIVVTKPPLLPDCTAKYSTYFENYVIQLQSIPLSILFILFPITSARYLSMRARQVGMFRGVPCRGRKQWGSTLSRIIPRCSEFYSYAKLRGDRTASQWLIHSRREFIAVIMILTILNCPIIYLNFPQLPSTSLNFPLLIPTIPVFIIKPDTCISSPPPVQPELSGRQLKRKGSLPSF